MEEITQFYNRYHSIRYVDDLLVMRLTRALDDSEVSGLEKRFGDILIPEGKFRLSGPLPIEIEEDDRTDLPRLVIDFNRYGFGRLRELIDAINRI